jgi:prenyltransferase beta subunit
LDASRPWIIYWVANALDILGALHAQDPTASLADGAKDDGSTEGGTVAGDGSNGDGVEVAAAMPEEMDGAAGGDGLAATSSPSSGSPLTARHLRRRIVSSLRACQNSGTGGFGGGNQQLAHCAPTYAAVLALVATAGGQGASAVAGSASGVGGGAAGELDVSDEAAAAEDAAVAEEAYGVVDRPALYNWFLSLKDAGPGGSGGFRMHADGEVDVRGTYTVVAVASLLNLLTPELTEGVAAFALSCQTYEGGFGGEPGAEAHGGYAFCAVAALAILGETRAADLGMLERWLSERQQSKEGGFAGRCNKLVDGCYTFWQGATCGILEHLHADPTCGGFVEATTAATSCGLGGAVPPPRRVFNSEALQRYTLRAPSPRCPYLLTS